MYSETASLHLSILLHYYYFNPYMNPVQKLQPRSNSAISFQIQEKTIAEASIISLLVKTYFPPKPITQQHGQKDSP